MIKQSIIRICALSFLVILAHVFYEIIHIDQAKQFADHLPMFLFAEIAVEFVLLIFCYVNYFRYKKPRWFWKFVIDPIGNCLIKRKLNKIYEQEKDGEQQKLLVKLALKKVDSTKSVDEKMRGIEHLYRLGTEKDIIRLIYKSLLNILETEPDGIFKEIIVQTICDFRKKLDK